MRQLKGELGEYIWGKRFSESVHPFGHALDPCIPHQRLVGQRPSPFPDALRDELDRAPCDQGHHDFRTQTLAELGG